MKRITGLCINVLAQLYPIFPLNYPLLNSVRAKGVETVRTKESAFLNLMLIAASLKSFGDFLLTLILKIKSEGFWVKNEFHIF